MAGILDRARAFADFTDKLICDSNGCWIWIGLSIEGYGSFRFERKSYRTHRIMWEFVNGHLDPSLILHHTCEVTLCVNPAHLEPLSPYMHAQRHKGQIRKGKSKLYVVKYPIIRPNLFVALPVQINLVTITGEGIGDLKIPANKRHIKLRTIERNWRLEKYLANRPWRKRT